MNHFLLALKCNVLSPPPHEILMNFSLRVSYLDYDPNADHPDEKNDYSKRLIWTKLNEYVTRAEKLKQHFAAEGMSI